MGPGREFSLTVWDSLEGLACNLGLTIVSMCRAGHGSTMGAPFSVFTVTWGSSSSGLCELHVVGVGLTLESPIFSAP